MLSLAHVYHFLPYPWADTTHTIRARATRATTSSLPKSAAHARFV